MKARSNAGRTEVEINSILPLSEHEKLLEIFPRGVVALDLETTGLSPLVDKIIELSAIKITPGKIESFDSLIDPEIPIPPLTTNIHGIKDEDVLNQPKINELLPKFIEFSNDLPLLAHNAKFDLGFLVFALHEHKLSFPSVEVYCSCNLSRAVFKSFPNHRLATLVKELEIPLENHHMALDDALASLRIFAKGLQSCESEKLKSSLAHARLFKVQDFNPDSSLHLPKHLEGLYEHVKAQEEIEIFYKGGSIKNQFRPVKPLSLLPMPQGSVLYALCLKSNMYKSFALSKIAEFRKSH